ncbi:hypothetical protein CMI39_00955 [Candidatus Pacearchaeota archaeon]|nr:hypothetical protein [Candidatus Pacearchaeota archaeon]|tara:strand:+ start:3224 stop:4225 length:1002 start_codon:yes stop_codon:yes gene_type:complete
MRLLISKNSRRILFNFFKENYKSNSLSNLSKKMMISRNTLDEWRYNYKRYIPKKLIPKEIFKDLEILDKQNNNWGRAKGGKKTYKVLLKKYGSEEIRKRQSNGGKKSKRKYIEQLSKLDLKNSLFLEFYGILLGDGWIGIYHHKNKTINLIGISGHSKLDREFFLYCKRNIKELFNRKAYLKERPNYNSIELQISHKALLKTLNKELEFPIGKKINLKIHKKILNLGFNSLKYVIRGIFDTDGCFYLDKTPVGNPYPCIAIEMKAPILIKQMNDILKKEGFKVIYKKDRNDSKKGQSRITLKGSIQLKKWMKEIGSSNPRHLNKINALVAQSG